MKPLLLTLGVLAGLLLSVAGIAGVILSGFDLLYGGVSLVLALAGGAFLTWCGGRIRSVSRAEAEGVPGRRSRQKPSCGPRPLDKGQRL